ncbi:MAG: asparaginase [Bacteroidetes bacterium]|nr:asparaginase [Bacteroidota bacterium]
MNRNPLAVTHRSGRIDALHYGSVVVTDPAGRILYSANDPHYPTYLRSSIKMIQALPVVLSGAVERFEFTDRELAICCASHVGADYHLATVAEMLRKIGLDEPDLGCGAHEPDDRAERKRLLCSENAPTQLHNNCSGKHTGMLAACVAKGWPVESYLEIDHPLQQWILDLMAEHSGIPRQQIGIGIDGCSLPAFYMPISGVSTALARFVAGAADPSSAAGRIMHAVRTYPEMINDVGGFDSEIIRATNGRAIAKRGAMAIFVVGITTEKYGPIGVTVKLEDGNMAPMPVVVMKVLEEMEVLTEEEIIALRRFRTIPLANWRGLDVGDVAADFSITAWE